MYYKYLGLFWLLSAGICVGLEEIAGQKVFDSPSIMCCWIQSQIWWTPPFGFFFPWSLAWPGLALAILHHGRCFCHQHCCVPDYHGELLPLDVHVGLYSISGKHSPLLASIFFSLASASLLIWKQMSLSYQRWLVNHLEENK